MKCISAQEFLFTTNFPSTRFLIRFRYNEEVCHVSQQMVSELEHAVIASDGKVYDAYMLQAWLMSQLKKGTSEFFVIPKMPIVLIYILEPKDIFMQFFEIQNLRYVANRIYSCALVAYCFSFFKCIAFLLLALKPKLVLICHFVSLLFSPHSSCQLKCSNLYKTTRQKKDVGIQCEIIHTKEKTQMSSLKIRKNKSYQIPSKNSAFHMINVQSK